MAVFGKVTGFEEKTVTVNKTEYKIAKIEVTDPVIAPKGTKTVRLGFVPPPPNVFISPRPFTPEVGMDGCFSSARPGGEFQVAPGGLSFVSSGSEKFRHRRSADQEVREDSRVARCGPEGKNAEDKFLAAAMLVARYSSRRGAKEKQEPIDAAQSKLILEVLAAPDWTPVADATKLSPLMVLGRLPLTRRTAGRRESKRPAGLTRRLRQRWVAEHAGTYRIQQWKAGIVVVRRVPADTWRSPMNRTLVVTLIASVFLCLGATPWLNCRPPTNSLRPPNCPTRSRPSTAPKSRRRKTGPTNAGPS